MSGGDRVLLQAQKNRDDCVRKDMQMGGVTEENGVIRWQVIHSEMVNMHLNILGSFV